MMPPPRPPRRTHLLREVPVLFAWAFSQGGVAQYNPQTQNLSLLPKLGAPVCPVRPDLPSPRCANQYALCALTSPSPLGVLTSRPCAPWPPPPAGWERRR